MSESAANQPSTPVRLAAGLATLVLMIAAASAILVIVTHFVGLVHGGHDVSFRGSVSVTADDSRMPLYIDRPGVANVTVHIDDASPKQELLSLARDLAPVLLILVGAWMVRAILLSVRRGDPFTTANVRRLRWVAALLVAIPVVVFIQHVCDNALASTVPDLREWPNGSGLSLDGPAAGVILLVISEVFAYGVRLREDVEGTV